jgi:hypothetical protein
VRSGGEAQLLAAAAGADAVVCEVLGHEAAAVAAVTALARDAATLPAAAGATAAATAMPAAVPAAPAAPCRPRVFVGITSPLAWAATPRLPPAPPPPDADGALSLAPAPAVAGEEPPAACEAEAEPPPPAPAYTERDAPARQPAAAAAAAHRAEAAVLKAARPGALATHVVLPGVLYGLGEGDAHMHLLLRAAWEGGALRQLGRGANRVPTLHVRALGGYVAALLKASAAALGHAAALAAARGPVERRALRRAALAGAGQGGGGGSTDSGASTFAPAEPQPRHMLSAGGRGGGGGGGSPGPVPRWPPPAPPPYLLVADAAPVAQAQLLAGAAAAFGPHATARIVPAVSVESLLLGEAAEGGGAPAEGGAAGALPLWGVLDLPLRTTPLPLPPAPAPSASLGGILEALPGVAAEMVAARRLAPLRLLVRGPPGSGKSHAAARLAARYGLRLVTPRAILAEAATCDGELMKARGRQEGVRGGKGWRNLLGGGPLNPERGAKQGVPTHRHSLTA